MRPSFTLGIEEEYQTVDPVTRDLRSHIKTEMLAKGKLRMEERVKAEMHQSVVEVGTRICRNIADARDDLYDLRRQMVHLAEEHDLVLVAGATHPFADWSAQDIYPDERYVRVVEDLQQVARANLIFGLHVHVGIEDREAAIRIMNSMRYFPPPHPRAVHQLALLAEVLADMETSQVSIFAARVHRTTSGSTRIAMKTPTAWASSPSAPTSVTRVIGNILQDEKFPGIHIAFGDPYGEHTGAKWTSSTHIDVVGLNFNIWLEGAAGEEQIMREGRFLIQP